MKDFQQEVRDLRVRLRLQMVIMIGAIIVGLFAVGGADVVARALVESDAWKVRTNNASSVLTDRITVTSGVDSARVKLTAANIELAQQPTSQLPAGAAPGALAYDSTTNTLKYRNATGWVESVVGSPGSAATPGLMQGRIAITSSPSTTLVLQQYSGDLVEVGGEMVSIGAAGKSLTTSTFLIDASGNNTASGMAAGLTYCIYISNSLATGAPRSIRAILSSTGTQPVPYNGTKYLGTTGISACWRFLGWVQTTSSAQFADSPSQRLVINYYNRRMLSLSCADSTSSWIYAGASFRQANGSTSNKVEFISNGEDAVFAQAMSAARPTSGGTGYVGIGVDSTTVNSAQIITADSGSISATSQVTATMCSTTIAAGYHTLVWLEKTDGVSTYFFTWYQTNTDQKAGLVAYCMG